MFLFVCLSVCVLAIVKFDKTAIGYRQNFIIILALHKVLISTPAVYPHSDDFYWETKFSIKVDSLTLD